MNSFNKIKATITRVGKTIAKPFVIAFNFVKKQLNKFFKYLASKKLTTLVLMQLKDKWNFSFKTNKKSAAFKLITYLVVFAIICALSFLIMNFAASTLHVFASNTIPINAMTVIITLVTLFEGISILIGLTNSLYFGKDNAVLITYPVKADYLFISKLIVYYIDAIKRIFTLLVPILFGFGLLKGYPVYFYFWVILWVIVYMLLIVAVCGLLSIPTFYVLRFLQANKIIRIIFACIVLGILIYLSILMIDIIPENINLTREFEKFSQGINEFLTKFSDIFKGMAALTALLCGVKKGLTNQIFNMYSWIVPLVMFAAIALLITIDMLVSKPFYNKMISGRNHFKNKQNTTKGNYSHSKGISVLKYETLRIIRDEKLVVSSIICVVVAPLLILLIDKFYQSFSVRYTGRILINVFNYFFILLIATSHNISSSYIFSKDGPSWNINKTIPVNPKLSLSLRLVYNFVISLLIIIPSACVFIKNSRFIGSDPIFIIISLILLSLFHNILSASYDFMHSENKTKADIGSEIIQKHETISIAYGLIISLVSSLFAFILFFTETTSTFLRVTIFALLILGLEIYLFFKRIRATYQEN